MGQSWPASFSAGSIAQYLFRIVFARYRSPRLLFRRPPYQAEVVSPGPHALHAARCDAMRNNVKESPRFPYANRPPVLSLSLSLSLALSLRGQGPGLPGESRTP